MKLKELYQSKVITLLKKLYKNMELTVPSIYSGLETVRDSLNNSKSIKGKDLSEIFSNQYNEGVSSDLLGFILSDLSDKYDIEVSCANVYNRSELWVIRTNQPLQDVFTDGYSLDCFRCINIDTAVEDIDTKTVLVGILIVGNEYDTQDELFSIIMDTFPKFYIEYIDLFDELFSRFVIDMDNITDSKFTDLLISCVRLLLDPGKDNISKALNILKDIAEIDLVNNIIDDYLKNIK